MNFTKQQINAHQIITNQPMDFVYLDYKYWKDNIKLFIEEYHNGLKEGFYEKTLESYLEFIEENMSFHYTEFYEKLYYQMKEYKKKHYIKIKK